MVRSFGYFAILLLLLSIAPVFAAENGGEPIPPISYSCAISPSSVNTAVDSSVQLSLTCYIHRGASTSVVPCDKASWSSTIGSVSGTNSGAVFNSQTTAGIGSILVSAETGPSTVSCSVPVTVAPAEAVEIAISPSSSSLTIGQSQKFTAKITDRYGNTVQGIVTWSVSSPVLGSITQDGLFTAIGAGSGNVRAAYGGIDSTASVTVSSPAPSYYCEISPSSLAIPVDSSSSLAITCYVQAHQISTPIACDSVSWSSTIGSVSGNSEGAIFNALTVAGSGRINAKSKISGNYIDCGIPANVLAGAPLSMRVSPSSASVSVGHTQQFSASLYDSYGNTVDYPGYFSWSVSSPKIGAISDSGLFTAISQGTTSVKAVYQGLDSSATVTVTSSPSSNRYCQISPKNSTVVVAENQKFQARCFQDVSGKVQEFDCPSLAWSASQGTVSEPTLEGGLQTVIFKAGKVAGEALLSAKYGGWSASEFIFCTNNIDILPGEAIAVEISPSSAQLVTGDTLGFSATVKDEFGNKIEGSRLFWSTSGGIGNISTGGLFTATNAGSGSVRVDVSCIASSEAGCPNDSAQIEVLSPSSPSPEGNTGSGTGGSGGTAFSSSATVSFTCAGAPATLSIKIIDPKKTAIVDLLYKVSQPPEIVVHQNASGNNTIPFVPPNAGAYELRVSVGTDQRTTSFSVPACAPSISTQVQNITVELKPVEEQKPSAPVPSGSQQQSESPTATKPKPTATASGKNTFFGIELPSDMVSLAAISAILAVLLLAAAYFLVFGKKGESG